jgi:cellulose synthase/poly-beta-1,6-N-acetylglucosamine synthase-like glycosyltransferase
MAPAQEGTLLAHAACDTGRLPGSAVSPLSLDDALFLAAAFCIFVQFAFYPLLLAVVRKTRPRALVQVAADRDDAFLPNVVVLVPTYNEADFVEGKLENLASLTYPPERFKVVVVDGQSSDDTLIRVEQFRSRSPFNRHRAVDRARKIPQLNRARTGADAVRVVTDADARFDDSDALRTVGYLRHNPEVGLVGGGRARRSEVGTCRKPSTASGQAKPAPLRRDRLVQLVDRLRPHAFPRSTVDPFPRDCIADDVHVALQNHLAGRRVVYAHDIPVTELRCPTDLRMLFQHKLRKANAYAIELSRFLHQAPFMGRRLKLVYFFKVFQFLYLPWALLGFGLLTLHLSIHGQGAFVGAVLGVLFLLTLAASLLMVRHCWCARGFHPRSSPRSCCSQSRRWCLRQRCCSHSGVRLVRSPHAARSGAWLIAAVTGGSGFLGARSPDVSTAARSSSRAPGPGDVLGTARTSVPSSRRLPRRLSPGPTMPKPDPLETSRPDRVQQRGSIHPRSPPGRSASAPRTRNADHRHDRRRIRAYRDTRYIQEKPACEKRLSASTARWTILYPSTVYGPGWIRARLPAASDGPCVVPPGARVGSRSMTS